MWQALASNGNGPTFRTGPTVDTTKPIEPVSAASPFSVSRVLGRSIPIVIGTGKVDGIPIIGGSTTAQIVTGYEQYPHTAAGALASGGSGFDSALDSYPPGSKWTTGDAFSKTVDVPVYGTQQSAQLGYLLAYDPFGDGYELIRVEINDEVVYDAEHGIGASENFRFYGGTQTTPDPITKSVLGTKAGAWQGFAMLFLSGYVADSAPTVKAVLSNAATGGGGTHDIAWVGSTPSTFTQNSTGRAAAYDPTQDVVYQLLGQNEVPGIGQINLSVLDAVTYTERYRIPLEGSEDYVGATQWIYAIRGSGLIFVRFAGASPVVDRVYDAVTGKIVSTHVESGETFDWKIGFPFGQSYIFTGFDFAGGDGLPYAMIDIAGQITIGRVPGATSGDLVYGRQGPGTISFFISKAAGTVDEAIFDGDAWTTTTRYTSSGIPTGSWYDPLTGYLIVFESIGAARYVRYVNPDTGVIADSITVAQAYFIETGTFATGRERYWPRPGYVLMTEGVDESGKVYLLSIGSKTISTYASNTSTDNLDFTTGIFDQNKQVYFQAIADDHWTEYQLPNTIPGLVPLSSLITKAMSLVGYGPSELTFDGFGGLSGYGIVIDSDTNIRTILQSGADIYGYSFTDTGSGFYFKKPGRDDAFALDAVLTTSDLVFGDASAIESTDEATIRSVSRVELDYRSKEQGYDSRPASFQMPAINNSIRVSKFSSPWVLSDLDAKTFVTQKFFELQARLRDHSYSLIGQPKVLPGDVVSVPSGAITYSVQIESVALNRDMSVDIQASDFQTAVQTTITPVTNIGYGNTVAVTLQTQYIHLDVPLFRYADDLGGLSLRQYGVVASRGQSGWGGGLLLRGDTSADLTAMLSQAPHAAVIGICTTVLGTPLDPFGTTDDSTVTFRKTTGSADLMVDKTEAQVLAGANFAFIGAPGRWEGVGYKTAVDNEDGTFTLSGFTIRGYRGTEVFSALHQVGDQFVMIDPAWLKSAPHPLADLGSSKYYKAIGLSQNPATGTVSTHSIIGAAETPYAPVNLEADLASPDGIDLSWDYRSRLASGLNPANFGEATLAFEIDIYDGATYKRTLTSTTGSVHYASADVVTDLGADPPATITFDVFMMSALDILVPGQARPVVGRGYRARRHTIFDPGAMTADNTIITADSTAFTADAA
ncbi:MAG: hypothetical protein EOR12_27090 [Mesorhizobium sp.]|uniref:GTA baseplate fiber-binding domain-containing protein n=1 Tax=Mesorhizobium sp. TaxID=1871066 RepID=UPI000FE93FFC|nr:phage tail protein [Mesorhizobium sp.]RWP84899.1 MAG: hypothetical protein EOR12_27090 [Mesorhizobium sp.]